MTQPKISIIIPTYNESQNIIKILKTIENNSYDNFITQTIIVDDDSPDQTGKIVEDYSKKNPNYAIDVIHRKIKSGLSSAILSGIQHASGDIIVIMDSDLSHPPEIIPKMIDIIKKNQYDIVVASRYVKEGRIFNWSFNRKIISKCATIIAKTVFGIKIKDPMSGFFAFKKNIINELKFDGVGYKILLELLIKTKGVRIKEIPYTFVDRKFGNSKFDHHIVFDYLKSVCKLYIYEKKVKDEPRSSIKFLSKAGRFYTVGAFGFVVNFFISMLFVGGLAEFWYIHANILGILSSMTSNFVLNKIWTFEDRDFSTKKVFTQYTKFIGLSSIGALIQLSLVFGFVESTDLSYPLSLAIGVSVPAFGNFILNKKLTFAEKIWS